jgi:hypothetical protein
LSCRPGPTWPSQATPLAALHLSSGTDPVFSDTVPPTISATGTHEPRTGRAVDADPTPPGHLAGPDAVSFSPNDAVLPALRRGTDACAETIFSPDRDPRRPSLIPGRPSSEGRRISMSCAPSRHVTRRQPSCRTQSSTTLAALVSRAAPGGPPMWTHARSRPPRDVGSLRGRPHDSGPRKLEAPAGGTCASGCPRLRTGR